MRDDVCVAPSSIAFSRLDSIGSTAMMCFAPAMRAPCTALMPIAADADDDDGVARCVSARFTAEPQPVATPHDTSATASSGRSSSTLMTDASATHGVLAEGAELGQQVSSSPPMGGGTCRR